jgi:hypothetical protein
MDHANEKKAAIAKKLLNRVGLPKFISPKKSRSNQKYGAGFQMVKRTLARPQHPAKAQSSPQSPASNNSNIYAP